MRLSSTTSTAVQQCHRVLEVPVAPYITHHAVNWTFERQQKDSERWLLSLTKPNSIIGMQNRCPRFPPAIFINLYRISRWLTWTSLVTFRCSSANYAAGRRQTLWFNRSFEKVTSWVMKSSAVHLAGVDEGCLISPPMQTFLFRGFELMQAFRPYVQRQGQIMETPLSFMFHCLPLLDKNAQPSKTASSSNEPTSFLAEVLMSEGFLSHWWKQPDVLQYTKLLLLC